MRHGEAISNVKQVVSSWPEKFKNPLTSKGRAQIKMAAKKLADKKIDLIFSSDLLRAKQTSEIIGKTLKINPKFDKRLREAGFGNLNGRPAEELLYLKFEEGKLNHVVKKSENYDDVLKRVSGFIKEINRKYKGKNILLVSHQCPLWILENWVRGFSLKEGLRKIPKKQRIGRGELRELN